MKPYFFRLALAIITVEISLCACDPSTQSVQVSLQQTNPLPRVILLSPQVLQMESDLILSLAKLDILVTVSGTTCSYAHNLQISDLLDGAYTFLLLRNRPTLQNQFGIDAQGAIARSQIWLGCALTFQDLTSGPKSADPSSTYGKFQWNTDNTVQDDNSIEFAAEGLSRTVAQFGKLFEAHWYQDVLSTHLLPTLFALQRHMGPFGPANLSPALPTYTNIFLGNAVAQVLLAESLADPLAVTSAYLQMDQWISQTRTTGINEYDSPFYYELDVAALEMGNLLATRKQDFQIGLNYFWTDIAANAFSGFLSGSHSRNYNFLSSRAGGLVDELFVKGLAPTQSTQGVDLSKVFVIAPAYSGTAYALSSSQTTISQLFPRWILSRVGGASIENPTGAVIRSNYVTQNYALGTSSQDYLSFHQNSSGISQTGGPQDRVFSLQFPTLPLTPLPDITINVNTAAANVYGAQSLDSSGHIKPHHDTPVYPNIVQYKNMALVLLDLNPNHMSSGVMEYSTNLTLPYALSLGQGRDALVYLDGGNHWQNAVLGSPPQTPGGTPSLVTLPQIPVLAGRSSAAGMCFAVKFFRVETAANTTPDPSWFALRAENVAGQDSNGHTIQFGWKQGAIRLALYHYLGGSGSGPVILPNKHMKVGFAFKAIACGSNAEFYALQTEFLALTVSETIQKDANSNDTIWSANVSWPDGTSLSASDDISLRTIVSQSINGTAIQAPASIQINGQDYPF